MRTLLLIGIFFFQNLSFADTETNGLRPFSSDGCTMFYDGSPSDPNLWQHCCFEHDLFFWAGGSRRHRDQADLNLRQCVADTGHKQIAEIMYRAVRLGAKMPWKFGSKRWANAWQGRVPYQALNAIEKLQIRWELRHYDIPETSKAKLLQSLND